MDDAQAVKIRPNMERRKLKAAGGRRRPKPPPLRPYSATEITQRPRVKTNNLIDFGEDEETAMETSVASATPAFRSLTPSTSSAVSIQWVSLQIHSPKTLFGPSGTFIGKAQ